MVINITTMSTLMSKMKVKENKEDLEKYLFGNFFGMRYFSSYQLLFFAQDVLDKLVYFNDHHEFDALINCLKQALGRLQKEIHCLEDDLDLPIADYIDVSQFIIMFQNAMINMEPEIAFVLGGNCSPTYFEFYPFGVLEYSHIHRKAIPTLINRVYTVTITNIHQLTPQLVRKLVAFKQFWYTNLSKKDSVYGVPSDSYKQTQDDVQKALLMTIHWIALNYPGDIESCTSFFDFDILFKKKYHPPKIH